MALSPRIELRQKQSLQLTPQLRQAIALLQMSNVDLAEFVASEVEKNPLLEIAPPVPGPAPQGHARRGGDGPEDALGGIAAELSLWDHLHRQILSRRLPSGTVQAALALADELEEDGYLRTPLDDIASRHGLAMRDVSRGLDVLQGCEPAGVGARNLRECLSLQLREADRLDPAMQAMLERLDLAVRGEIGALERHCGVDAEDIAEMLAELRALDPKPGLRFSRDPVQIAVPDVFVTRAADGRLQVDLNTETLPRVLMDNAYSARIGGGRDETARVFISECRTSASWLVRALEQRAQTLLKVAIAIAGQQERFFSDGVAALRPLTRRTIAAQVSLHESTVSRAVSGKFLGCDQGILSLSYFFCSSVGAMAGESTFSATAIQNRIRLLVDGEPARRPLSDDKLAGLLRADGIDIARRTVAKYRDVLGIPSSVDRRRQKAARV